MRPGGGVSDTGSRVERSLGHCLAEMGVVVVGMVKSQAAEGPSTQGLDHVKVAAVKMPGWARGPEEGPVSSRLSRDNQLRHWISKVGVIGMLGVANSWRRGRTEGLGGAMK